MRADDLAPLLAGAGDDTVRFRQGVVLAWDQLTAENTIDVAGTVLSNVPCLNTNEAVLLDAGAVVGILVWKQSWFVLGRITVPGTADAASALRMVSNRIYADTVSTVESVTSTTYGDLATAGPTVSGVTISSGKALVFMSFLIQEDPATPASRGAEMSFEITGPTNLSADFTRRLLMGHIDDGIVVSSFSSNNLFATGTKLEIVESLTPGTGYTFQAKYKRTANQGGVTLGHRKLVVMPF